VNIVATTTIKTEFGPDFAAVKRQSAPCRNITDLGINMTWGEPGRRHQARLYWNAKELPTRSLTFEQVLIHEEDTLGTFPHQPAFARVTEVGKFYPFSAYLLHLYAQKEAGRDVLEVLTELSRLLPQKRTESPITGKLNAVLEKDGFRVTNRITEPARALLDIGWVSADSDFRFFVGILEVKTDGPRLKAQWVLPGLIGINHLLQGEFQKRSASLADCLAEEYAKQVIAELQPQKHGKQTLHVRNHDCPGLPERVNS